MSEAQYAYCTVYLRVQCRSGTRSEAYTPSHTANKSCSPQIPVVLCERYFRKQFFYSHRFFFFTQRGLHSHPWMTPVTHPSSRLQEATQCPSRITCRQEKHMSGPGPQQPSAVHISSHTLFSVTFRGQEKDSSGLLGALSSWCLLSD